MTKENITTVKLRTAIVQRLMSKKKVGQSYSDVIEGLLDDDG